MQHIPEMNIKCSMSMELFRADISRPDQPLEQQEKKWEGIEVRSRYLKGKGYTDDGKERAELCLAHQCLIGRVGSSRPLLPPLGEKSRSCVCAGVCPGKVCKRNAAREVSRTNTSMEKPVQGCP